MNVKQPDQALQRAGPLAALPQLVAELGADPAGVFLGSGLAPSDLRADHFIPLSLFAQLLDRAASVTGRPDFALLLGLRQSRDSLGPVGLIMSFAPTLGEALADFVSFQIDNSRGGAAYLHRMGDDFALGFGVYDPDFRSSHAGYDLALTVGCNMIRRLTDGQIEPVEILMMRRVPADPAPYRQLARCPVRFNQSQCCIILPARSMQFRLKTADSAARATLLKSLNERLSRPPWGVTGQVRHSLRPLLLLGRDSLADIAGALGMHRRTLERHLHQEGTSFDAIRDEVRFALARDLLAHTILPIGDIAASLAYGSHSSFVHAFRRWAATTPTLWRKNSLASREPPP